MKVWVLLALLAGFATGQAQEAKTEAEFATNGDPQLSVYLQTALESNPAISQALAGYRAGMQKLPQVSALPNPMLAFTNETRVGSQTNAVTFTQQFPWFGTLSAREQIAAKEAAMLRKQYDATKDQIIWSVKTSYYSLSLVDRALTINDEDRLLLEHYEELAESLYQQGTGLQQAVVKLQAEITRNQSQSAELRSRRVDAEASLNALLNRPADTPVSTVALPPVLLVELDYKQLYRVGRQNRPDLLAALLQIERDEKRIDLARKDRWPGFSLGGAFVNVNARPPAPGAVPMDQNGNTAVAFNIGVELPVRRSRYDAEVAEATESKLASTHGYQDTVNSIEASIREAGSHISTLSGQIALFNNTLIPQAEQSLQSAEAAYSTGGLGVLDLLDSERVLLQVRLGLAQMTSDYMKSLADMERAIGAPFPEVKP